MSRSLVLLVTTLIWVSLVACSNNGNDGSQGPTGPSGPPGPEGPPGHTEPTTAVETCVGCHGPTGIVPVGNILDSEDPHFVDTEPDGPLTGSGYRRLELDLTSVDVTGESVVIEFVASDESGIGVGDLFSTDGRFTIARLDPPAARGDSSTWISLITRTENPGGVGTGDGTPESQADSESFASASGTFENLGAGSYRYSSGFDPTAAPILGGDLIRVAIQISATDLPASNGWCDFQASLIAANDCVSTPKLRDIVQASSCNACHGVTSEVKLALHGGGRTEIEYCVTCHDPGTVDANSDNVLDMKQFIHKIHFGSQLSEPYQIWGFRNSLHDYSTVSFTKDIDDCTNCHGGSGAEADNWSEVPTIEACGSCHDDVNFASGANHRGGVQTSNEFCAVCHPATGPWTPGTAPAPVQTVHRGEKRAMEASRYAFVIDDVSFDSRAAELTVDYRVNKDGAAMDLAADAEWTASGGASRLAVTVGWETADYTNQGGSPPASPLSIDALDLGGAATARAPGLYRIVQSLPSSASNTVTVGMEGHPAADLDGDGAFGDRLAIRNVLRDIDVAGGRTSVVPRRTVVDVGKCNQCHDAAGQGISLHGNNRTGETQVCVVCHNANNTDIGRRPSDPSMALDGKKEEAIDFKRMIHQIHAGSELSAGLVIYGFGGGANDFGEVEFIGNLQNCETCHLPGTYGIVNAGDALPTTIDTGSDLADPDDDLNISPMAAVCSSCHDHAAAKDHMKLHGASFKALDADIH